jgi:hypothetical protein
MVRSCVIVFKSRVVICLLDACSIAPPHPPTTAPHVFPLAPAGPHRLHPTGYARAFRSFLQ